MPSKLAIRTFLLLLLSLLTTNAFAVFKQYDELESIKLAYYGKPDILYDRLSIDPLIKISLNSDEHGLDNTDAVFIYDKEIDGVLLENIMERVERGDLGLVINLGENISSSFLSNILGTKFFCHPCHAF